MLPIRKRAFDLGRPSSTGKAADLKGAGLRYVSEIEGRLRMECRRGAEEDAGVRAERRQELNDLINTVIRLTQQQGRSLQALRNRVRERLLAQPRDHILVVEEEPGLHRLLQSEIRQAMRWRDAACSRKDLAVHPGLAKPATQTLSPSRL